MLGTASRCVRWFAFSHSLSLSHSLFIVTAHHPVLWFVGCPAAVLDTRAGISSSSSALSLSLSLLFPSFLPPYVCQVDFPVIRIVLSLLLPFFSVGRSFIHSFVRSLAPIARSILKCGRSCRMCTSLPVAPFAVTLRALLSSRCIVTTPTSCRLHLLLLLFFSIARIAMLL